MFPMGSIGDRQVYPARWIRPAGQIADDRKVVGYYDLDERYPNKAKVVLVS